MPSSHCESTAIEGLLRSTESWDPPVSIRPGAAQNANRGPVLRERSPCSPKRRHVRPPKGVYGPLERSLVQSSGLPSYRLVVSFFPLSRSSATARRLNNPMPCHAMPCHDTATRRPPAPARRRPSHRLSHGHRTASSHTRISGPRAGQRRMRSSSACRTRSTARSTSSRASRCLSTGRASSRR